MHFISVWLNSPICADQSMQPSDGGIGRGGQQNTHTTSEKVKTSYLLTISPFEIKGVVWEVVCALLLGKVLISGTASRKGWGWRGKNWADEATSYTTHKVKETRVYCLWSTKVGNESLLLISARKIEKFVLWTFQNALWNKPARHFLEQMCKQKTENTVGMLYEPGDQNLEVNCQTVSSSPGIPALV